MISVKTLANVLVELTKLGLWGPSGPGSGEYTRERLVPLGVAKNYDSPCNCAGSHGPWANDYYETIMSKHQTIYETMRLLLGILLELLGILGILPDVLGFTRILVIFTRILLEFTRCNTIGKTIGNIS